MSLVCVFTQFEPNVLIKSRFSQAGLLLLVPLVSGTLGRALGVRSSSECVFCSSRNRLESCFIELTQHTHTSRLHLSLSLIWSVYLSKEKSSVSPLSFNPASNMGVTRYGEEESGKHHHQHAHTHTHRKYNNRQSTAQKINYFISMLH